MLLLFIVFLPQPIKQALYRRIFGWHIERKVKIGFSYIDAREVVLKEGVRIGHLNIIRRLRLLHLEHGVGIHHSNQITGAARGFPRAASAFTMERGSWLTGHHYIDCPGTVEIGAGTILGGSESQIWSHSLRVVPGGYEMITLRVRIGKGVYVGARSIVMAERVPDGAVIAAGSVVNKTIDGQDCRLLIAGNPATVRKRYEGTLGDGEETSVVLIPGDG